MSKCFLLRQLILANGEKQESFKSEYWAEFVGKRIFWPKLPDSLRATRILRNRIQNALFNGGHL